MSSEVIRIDTVGVAPVRWRARSNTSESVVVWPVAAASSIYRAVSSRCAYHHAASSASDLNLGILRFSFILLWRGVCGNRPDRIATKGEHGCQNTAGRPSSPTLWCVLHPPQTGVPAARILVKNSVRSNAFSSNRIPRSKQGYPDIGYNCSSCMGKCRLLSVINIKPCAKATAAMVASASERVWPLRAQSYRSRPALRAITRVTS